jgi:hypothetical protein
MQPEIILGHFALKELSLGKYPMNHCLHGVIYCMVYVLVLWKRQELPTLKSWLVQLKVKLLWQNFPDLL